MVVIPAVSTLHMITCMTSSTITTTITTTTTTTTTTRSSRVSLGTTHYYIAACAAAAAGVDDGVRTGLAPVISPARQFCRDGRGESSESCEHS